jgi:hypothetical protein
MILATHGVVGSSIGQKPIVSDSDAQAFIDRVYTAGGNLSITEANAVNDLVIDMKADGIWTKMKAIYPLVGGGTGSTAARQAACAQNLKSSNFTGTFSAGWTFASTGAKPNGTSAYMDTGFIPNTSLSLNNTHIAHYSRTQRLVSSVDIGAFNEGQNRELAMFRAHLSVENMVIQYAFPNNANRYNTTNTTGLLIGSRTASNYATLFDRGNKQSTITLSSTGLLPTISLYIGNRNPPYFASPLNQSASANECAFASIGDGLTDTEASNFYTAVQAFQTTLSRNV